MAIITKDMKKKFYPLTLLLMATLNVVLSSCGNDEDDMDRSGAAKTIDGKRLVKMTYPDDNETVSYAYNSSGQISMVSYDEGKYEDSYSYDKNNIVITSTRYSSYVGGYTLLDGRISKAAIEWSTSQSKYTYNEENEYNDGYLYTVITKEYYNQSSGNTKNYYKKNMNTQYTWKDGNLIYEKTEGTEETTTEKIIGYNYSDLPISTIKKGSVQISIIKEYTYTEHPNVLPDFNIHSEAILGWQGYYGRTNKNLLQKVVETEKRLSLDNQSLISTKTNTTTFNYTFNGELVTKLVEKTSGNQTDNSYTVTFAWE